MIKPEQQIFQSIFSVLQQQYKYYYLKKNHRINMQVFQEQMTLSSQRLLQLCTYYEEIENRGAQWELLFQDYLQSKGVEHGYYQKSQQKKKTR